jgi:HAD superfamily hydrolase (TIGR01509 family)
MRFADLDAVTVDGFGTLVQLIDPVPRFRQALADHGFDRTPGEVEEAFRAEAAHYRPRAHLAHDAETLAAFRLECVDVFLRELGKPLEPAEFVDEFIAALVFEPVPGAPDVLERLRAHGLRLAVVANWDCALPDHLRTLGLDRLVDTVVTSARAGVPKPDPAIFELALRELGVQADRALHVGDEPCDEEGAHAAGLGFAPAPLVRAFEGWT